MEEESLDLKSKIFFYFRSQYFNSMIAICKDGAQKFRNDSSFDLFHAMALFLNNRLEECVNQLEALKNESHVQLASVIALMYSHKMLGVSNKELFHKLDTQMRELRKTTDAIDFYHSAFVLFMLNKPEKALDYVDKALNIQSELSEALNLKGWILLKLKKFTHKAQNVIDTFESGLKFSKKNLDSSLGLSEVFLTQNRIEDALNTINKAIVRSPNTYIPLVQKMKIQVASQEWEQAIETMNRIIRENLDDLDALRTNIIILLCKDANYEEAVSCIKKFVEVLGTQEHKNARLLLTNAQLFSKISCRNADVLNETLKIVEKTVQINAESVEFVVELGHQYLLQGRIKDAQKSFKTASKIDDSSLQALLGLTLCELAVNGKTEQIKKQVDFLLELEEAQNSPHLYLLRARICESSEESLLFLKKAADIQLGLIKSLYYSANYLQILDPEFMIEIVKEFFKHVSGDMLIKKSATPQNILKTVNKACPGSYEAAYLLAKLQYLNGETTGAINSLEQVLSKIDGETSSDVYLLMAQIQVKSGYFERAAQSLEVGLSHNFKVRENTLYHYIRGLVDKNIGNLPDAIKSLTTSLSLSEKSHDLTLSEKSSVYIELIEAHNLIGQTEEASKLLESAIEELRGTSEEARILVLNADYAIKRKNVQGAMELLNKVKPNESYYLQARTKLAEILLKYRLDKYAYLQCYQDMVDENPNSDTYLLLGDAYMTILEPDDALECYNLALQQNPNDPILTTKMGKALVETHYFAKAIAFYKESIKTIQNPDLKLQLADLYLQLKEFDKAEMLLMDELEADNNQDSADVTYLQHKTRVSMLLAQTREKAGNLIAALAILKDAKDNQNRVRKRLSVDLNNIPEEEISLLVEINVKLADICTTLKNNDQAVQFYKDALEISTDNIQILTSLAKLYMQMNLLESCQQICTNILAIEPENEHASVMMADIAFRKIDFDMALFHFTQLLTKQPTNWTALVRLVEVMRRTGNLNDFPEYLVNAERDTANPSKDGGLLFCKALFQWYSGNLNGALRNFNLARQDPEWGQQALCNMIEICLNPDDEMLSDQFMDTDDIEYRDSRSMALKTSDRLLKELKNRLEPGSNDTLKYRLLLNFRLLANQDKHSIERGLEDFVAIASQNNYKEHVGPILGMATGYTLLKQSQRAKNQLKRVVKTSWTFEDAEYLERCWLLLADYYIQSAKYDVAGDLLNKVVQHNKTCSKAYEYLGFIAEKEQRFKDAASNYEQAWRFNGKTNPSIGFKLAYTLMKCKNYADAIDAAQQVLKLNPDYPKIKKEILDKSMNNLRC